MKGAAPALGSGAAVIWGLRGKTSGMTGGGTIMSLALVLSCVCLPDSRGDESGGCPCWGLVTRFQTALNFWRLGKLDRLWGLSSVTMPSAAAPPINNAADSSSLLRSRDDDGI